MNDKEKTQQLEQDLAQAQKDIEYWKGKASYYLNEWEKSVATSLAQVKSMNEFLKAH